MHPFLAAALFVAAGCYGSAQDEAVDKISDDSWAVSDNPEALGWSSDRLYDLTRYADSLNSAAIMVVTRGSAVFTYGELDRNFRAHSIRKSLLGALYGIHVASGKIDTSSTLAELNIDDKQALTPRELEATLADLLKARSGIYHPAASEVASMRDSRPARGQHSPGTFWYYNNWDFNVLGTVFRQETGEDVFESFSQHIAEPLAMEDFDLDSTRYQLEDVSIHPSYKFRISARDLVRFGQLYLNEGAWNGNQIIPATWVRASTRPYSITGQTGTKSGFGLMWWTGTERPGAEAAKYGTYTASGTGGQRLTVIPGIETVVVHRMDTDRASGPRIGSSAYDRFLDQLLKARRD